MSIQIVLLSKSSITNVTFECFFPSWTVLTCMLKVLLSPNLLVQMSHLSDFFPSWTVATTLSIHVRTVHEGKNIQM